MPTYRDPPGHHRLVTSVALGVLAAACGGDEAPPGFTVGGADARVDGTPIADAADAGRGDAGAPEAASDVTIDAVKDAGPLSESWVWPWMEWSKSLGDIATHASSFTHVSPALYTLNYSYSSGVAYFSTCPLSGSDVCTGPGPDSFDGMTSAEVAQQMNAAGLRCVPLIFGGVVNNGTNRGISNLVDDVAGAQASFITAMVAEAQAKGYAGYNLDWEVGPTIGSAYGTKLVAFVNAFKAALAPHGMTLSMDLIGEDILQTSCSTGQVDLQTLGASSIDHVFLEAYESTLGGPSMACRPVQNPQPCPQDVVSFFDLICAYVPLSKAGIAFASDPKDNNPVAGSAFTALEGYGIENVAVWPASIGDGPDGGYLFLDNTKLAPAGTWYSLLSQFHAQ
jgi:hypothetical protein